MTSEERPSKIRRLSSPGAPNKSLSPSPSPEHSQPPTGRQKSSSPPRQTTITTPTPTSTPSHLPSLPAIPAANTANPLSKSQLKRQRKRLEWEASRPERKAFRKQKDKDKKARKRAAAAREAQPTSQDLLQAPLDGDGAGPRQLVESGNGVGIEPSTSTSITSVSPFPTSARPAPTKSVLAPITIMLDCSFSPLMNEREIISLSSQITRAYSETARARVRAHLVLAGWGGAVKERFDGVLEGYYRRWKGVRVFEEEVGEVVGRAGEWMSMQEEEGWRRVFGGGNGILEVGEEGGERADNGEGEGEVVYLTSDSPNALSTLRPNSVYIIGGIVDKNRYKGLCLQRAQDAGIKTARLPIGEYMKMKTRQVLTVNHVVEILLRWLEGGDWGAALDRVVPKRKGGVLRNDEDDREDEGEGKGKNGKMGKEKTDGTGSGLNGLTASVVDSASSSPVSSPLSDPVLV